MGSAVSYAQCLLLAEYQKKNRTINKCDFLILNIMLVTF